MNPHVQSLNIKSFRGLQNVPLEGLGSFNLLVGENNSGKTSVLEALMLMLRPGDSRNWINLLNARDAAGGAKSRQNAVEWLFPIIERADPVQHRPIELECKQEYGNASIRSTLIKKRPPEEPIESPTPDISLEYFSDFSKTEPTRSGGIYFTSCPGSVPEDDSMARSMFRPWIDKEILNIPGARVEIAKPHGHRTSRASLRLLLDSMDGPLGTTLREIIGAFDSDIINIVRFPSGTLAGVDLIEHRKLGFLPLHSYGDGVRKAAYLLEMLLRSRDGVILLDEAETALHYSIQQGFFEGIADLTKRLNVQLFATTHSLDTVDAILKAWKGVDPPLVAFHLTQGSDGRSIKRLPEDFLNRARFQRGMDIR